MKRVRVEELPKEFKTNKRARVTAAGQIAFVKGGEKPVGSGRKLGQQNRHTTILKEIIMQAMEKVGDNNRGRGEAVGYMAHLAWKHPEIFGRLLEKVLPFSLTGAGGGPVQVEYTDKHEIALRFKERGLPMPPNLLEAPKRKSPKDAIDVDFSEIDREEEEA